MFKPSTPSLWGSALLYMLEMFMQFFPLDIIETHVVQQSAQEEVVNNRLKCTVACWANTAAHFSDGLTEKTFVIHVHVCRSYVTRVILWLSCSGKYSYNSVFHSVNSPWTDTASCKNTAPTNQQPQKRHIT